MHHESCLHVEMLLIQYCIHTFIILVKQKYDSDEGYANATYTNYLNA